MKKTLFIISLLVLSTACQRNPNARNHDNSMRSDAPAYDQKEEGRDGQRYDCCGNSAGNEKNKASGSNNAQEDDCTINERVRNALYNDPNMPQNTRAITVETRDRVVTLSGQINTKDEANFLIRKVKGIQGVRSVNNQITVAGQCSQGQSNNQGQ